MLFRSPRGTRSGHGLCQTSAILSYMQPFTPVSSQIWGRPVTRTLSRPCAGGSDAILGRASQSGMYRSNWDFRWCCFRGRRILEGPDCDLSFLSRIETKVRPEATRRRVAGRIRRRCTARPPPDQYQVQCHPLGEMLVSTQYSHVLLLRTRGSEDINFANARTRTESA